MADDDRGLLARDVAAPHAAPGKYRQLNTDIVCGKHRKVSHYIASMLPHQGSYALWRATTQPFKGATGKFVASGPFCCPCACPLTPIGIQLTLGVGCHSTNKGAAIFDKALVSKYRSQLRGTVTRATHG